MSTFDEILAEEYEVLTSIYPEEIEKTADDELEIRVEPEEQIPNEESELILHVHYPPTYPDTIPDLRLTTSDGELSDEEEASLLEELKISGEESIGMAMVFTLVSTLQESVRALVERRIQTRNQEAADRAKREAEAEEARTRGTAVTLESFAAWKARFEAEQARKTALEEEERMKAMPPKEREEYKKSKNKPSGRQLFERNKNLAEEDEDQAEEGVTSVDISQYDRTAAEREEKEKEENIVYFSDSD